MLSTVVLSKPVSYYVAPAHSYTLRMFLFLFIYCIYYFLLTYLAFVIIHHQFICC